MGVVSGKSRNQFWMVWKHVNCWFHRSIFVSQGKAYGRLETLLFVFGRTILCYLPQNFTDFEFKLHFPCLIVMVFFNSSENFPIWHSTLLLFFRKQHYPHHQSSRLGLSTSKHSPPLLPQRNAVKLIQFSVCFKISVFSISLKKCDLMILFTYIDCTEMGILVNISLISLILDNEYICRCVYLFTVWE